MYIDGSIGSPKYPGHDQRPKVDNIGLRRYDKGLCSSNRDGRRLELYTRQTDTVTRERLYESTCLRREWFYDVR